MFPSEAKEQVPFDEKASYELVRDKRIPLNCHDKKLDMQFKYV